jgi:hypothetical protein
MARQQGARTALAFAYESTYGTAPGSGYVKLPYVSTTLGAEQPLLDDDILGLGRDPQAPIKDALTADGDVVVPIDSDGFGYWLKLLFGAPASSTATVAATGSIGFSAQPAPNSTVTINGTAFTFVASGATGNQCNIGVSLSATMTALATVLNASVVAGVAAATYTGAAAALTIVHDTLGVAGNTFTLAASTSPASNGTVSGATLTGGAVAHTFHSGGWTLPSASIEKQMPDVPSFPMYSGIKADRLAISMARSGLLNATVGLVAQGETLATATNAGTVADLAALQRFGHFNGAIKRNTVSLANIETAEVNYMNNLDRIETIRADGKIDGLDPSKTMMNGNITARFADTVLMDQAIAGTPCDLEFSWTIGASAYLTITAHAVYLPRPRVEVPGPGGLRATFDWQAATAVSPARMATVVLVNSVASY